MRELKQHPVITIRDKKRVPFTYNGKQYWGNEDEAVSSALIANNIHIFPIIIKTTLLRDFFAQTDNVHTAPF
ncbi:MAG: 2Fe-2S iron-sulfur cluster-binding protein [Candidatus Marinimicrobia bacterium]|nr:2Fe-2S iron-sulfur cluster-binding protein [Candidatus Neomarinimicrobiota bacterium]